ncbi:MAG TPA: hypothetical protein VLM89_10555 [Phycisphaerae bacterium]|nr:hypothetical protein [Phycisphaerae bacterium]
MSTPPQAERDTGQMADPPASLADEVLPPPAAVIHWLAAFVIAVALMTPVGLAAGVLLLGLKPVGAAGVHILLFTGVLILGLSAIGVLISAVAAIRRLDRLAENLASLQQHMAIRAEQAAAGPARATPADPESPRIRKRLDDIFDILLLPDDQRNRRFELIRENEIEACLVSSEKLANANDFHVAREQLQAFRDRFGTDPRITEMEKRIEQQAQAAQEMDLRQARDHISDLISLNQWDQAELLTRDLSERYPNSLDTMALFQHVCRERQLFEQRHRSRLHTEIQEHVHQRRWQEAAQAARQFLGTFPTGPDSDALRAQLDALEANAEIQTRQQLEAEIKNHLHRQEYWDALALARRIIAEYPFSPQAGALRRQLARLEELARNQK